MVKMDFKIPINQIDMYLQNSSLISAACQLETAISKLNKIPGTSKSEHEPHIPSLLLGAKLCSQDQIWSLG